MYSVFLIMILVFLVIIINFIDQKNNLKKGILKPALVSAYTIVSPSMVPNINVLDVIITTRVSDPSKIKVDCPYFRMGDEYRVVRKQM